MATWLDPEEDSALILALWPDAPDDTDGVLTIYLDAARDACSAYAPALQPDEGGAVDVPHNYRLAQMMQAANLWNAAQASPGGDLDGGGFGLTTHPLDWQVKQLLRPRRAIGAIL